MTSGTKPRIVFFGSGPVAAHSLELLSEHCTIEAVITKPKPAHHHGDFPVLDMAKRLKLPVHTANNKAELDTVVSQHTFTSHLGVLIDFGIIVSQKVIDSFSLGIINSHFSLLPEWRGADPITFAILSGQEITGVSLMLLVAAMDEGPLVSYGEEPLTGTETTPELTKRLILLSDALLRDGIPRYMENKTTVPQDITGRQVSYSRKLTKEDGVIDWRKSAEEIEREIRAFIEWPKSRTTLAGKDVVITKAHVVPGNDSENKPGDIEVVDKFLMIECREGTLCIDRLKPAGKQEMTAEAFLAGHRQLL